MGTIYCILLVCKRPASTWGWWWQLTCAASPGVVGCHSGCRSALLYCRSVRYSLCEAVLLVACFKPAQQQAKILTTNRQWNIWLCCLVLWFVESFLIIIIIVNIIVFAVSRLGVATRLDCSCFCHDSLSSFMRSLANDCSCCCQNLYLNFCVTVSAWRWVDCCLFFFGHRHVESSLPGLQTLCGLLYYFSAAARCWFFAMEPTCRVLFRWQTDMTINPWPFVSSAHADRFFLPHPLFGWLPYRSAAARCWLFTMEPTCCVLFRWVVDVTINPRLFVSSARAARCFFLWDPLFGWLPYFSMGDGHYNQPAALCFVSWCW